MRTAIITGASSGLGQEFARQFTEVFPNVECVWLIARRRERLEAVQDALAELQVEILPLDLCEGASFAYLEEKLRLDQPNVTLLINCAGCGYLGNVGEMPTQTQTRMVDLNVRALTAVTNLVLPYMKAGARILNVSSIASFCVNPRMTVYSASKAYVSRFTVGISEELRKKGIHATAVCPGPMETEFLTVGGITGNSRMFETLPYCDQVRVAAGALRAARAGRTIYTPKMFYKFYRLAAKLLPEQLVAKIAKT
ncbi:SDR family NAD(P)-dependent oxidoreductase [Oscillibacter hominis]|uniref:SDR family NAD(P)-dependent oxidoreductase n=1 Tax=Oscillibacter hominis TaxID=2763056 RepID=A0A7G9B5Y8_9FIRM|nr:SDR family NAD(P)-dependent oxidoreductase [Oscillibacter hominis]QNL44969.1 SDR family NAD(P)-dependent oxidoreductase [Oscillibacter hominis]